MYGYLVSYVCVAIAGFQHVTLSLWVVPPAESSLAWLPPSWRPLLQCFRPPRWWDDMPRQRPGTGPAWFRWEHLLHHWHTGWPSAEIPADMGESSNSWASQKMVANWGSRCKHQIYRFLHCVCIVCRPWIGQWPRLVPQSFANTKVGQVAGTPRLPITGPGFLCSTILLLSCLFLDGEWNPDAGPSYSVSRTLMLDPYT